MFFIFDNVNFKVVAQVKIQFFFSYIRVNYITVMYIDRQLHSIYMMAYCRFLAELKCDEGTTDI